MKRVSVYVRNKELTPSSYYRIVQYVRGFKERVIIREIAPKLVLELRDKASNKNVLLRGLIDCFYYIVMLFRLSFFLIIDNLRLPDYVIVSKAFCPRYSPIYLLGLIKLLVKRTKLYWDFDDYIFISGEITNRQKDILETYSKNIIVTNYFLKGKIASTFQDKVLIMPTTDGDLQGFDKAKLMNDRRNAYLTEVRLIWIATSGNIIHLLRIIDSLDIAAKKLFETFHKQLILTVVCDKPIVRKTQKLVIRNITWTREIAKAEIYNSHIGIMPLANDEYSMGKGGFKLVQYISAGLPVIASKVGYNKEIVDDKCGVLVEDDEGTEAWIDGIMKLAVELPKWSEFSNYAYSKWLERFPFSDNMQKWNQLIRE